MKTSSNLFTVEKFASEEKTIFLEGVKRLADCARRLADMFEETESF